MQASVGGIHIQYCPFLPTSFTCVCLERERCVKTERDVWVCKREKERRWGTVTDAMSDCRIISINNTYPQSTYCKDRMAITELKIWEKDIEWKNKSIKYFLTLELASPQTWQFQCAHEVHWYTEVKTTLPHSIYTHTRMTYILRTNTHVCVCACTHN